MAFLDLRRSGAARRLPLASALNLIVIRPDRRMARGHKIRVGPAGIELLGYVVAIRCPLVFGQASKPLQLPLVVRQ